MKTIEKPETKLSAAFKKRNARFKAADKAGKRVLIARDVLKQLKTEKIKASHGQWAHLEFDNFIGRDEQVCSLLETKSVQCDCCALGAMMISEVRHTNKLTVGQIKESWQCKLEVLEFSRGGEADRLKKYFSHAQQRLIEIAFEEGSGAYFPSSSTERAACNFGEEKIDDNERLKNIMKNIVKNGGTFKP